MVTRRVLDSMGPRYWDEPSSLELVMIILNYVACIPVLLAVGGFSLYHFYSLLGNTTTIEGWEKDKAALMVKRGKLREIKFPYDLGKRRNIESVLGPNPLLWCWPRQASGSGMKFELSGKDGETWPPEEHSSTSTSSAHSTDPHTNSSPWTYENENLNPSLRPSNSQIRQSPSARRRRNIAGTSAVPPYHPDYQDESQNNYEQDYSDDEDEDSYMEEGAGKIRVRRGSEGYEIRPQGREEMLRRYLEEQGEDPGRYLRYIPQPDSESGEDDDVPLVYRTEVQRDMKFDHKGEKRC